MSEGERNLYAEAGHVSVEEARDLVRLYHRRATGERFEPGERTALMTIPPDPARDADLRLEAFLQRVERLEAAPATVLEHDPDSGCWGCPFFRSQRGAWAWCIAPSVDEIADPLSPAPRDCDLRSGTVEVRRG